MREREREREREGVEEGGGGAAHTVLDTPAVVGIRRWKETDRETDRKII